MAIVTHAEKCPSCGARCRWTVTDAGTEIRYHTCRRGWSAGTEYVIAIGPARAASVRGQAASITVITWTPKERSES